MNGLAEVGGGVSPLRPLQVLVIHLRREVDELRRGGQPTQVGGEVNPAALTVQADIQQDHVRQYALHGSHRLLKGDYGIRDDVATPLQLTAQGIGDENFVLDDQNLGVLFVH